MAHVRVVRHEAEQGLLPPVCVVCGAAATTMIPRKFGWRSKWRIVWGVILVPASLIIAVLIDLHLSWLFGGSILPANLVGGCLISLAFYLLWFGRRSMNLQLSFCEKHCGYWQKRARIGGAFRLVFLMSICLGVLFERAVTLTMKIDPVTLGVSIFLGLVVLFVLLLIASIAIQYAGIHEARIDDQSIILKNVSDGFAKAVAAAHLDAPLQPIPIEVDPHGIQAASPDPTDPTDPRIRPQ